MSRLLLLALLIFTGQSDLAAAEPLFDESRLKEQVEARLKAFVAEQKIAGAVTLVATKDNAMQQVVSVGKADLATGRDMHPDTIFRIASMTKLVTAVALMHLVEQGRISLDDPVSAHIPAFEKTVLADGKPSRAITVRELVTHTSGLRNPNLVPPNATLEQQADLIAATPLAFPPGTKWQYGNGLTVAGRLVEVISGQPFDDYVQQHICGPLGMKDTAYVLTADQAKRLATTYKPGTDDAPLAAVEIPDPTVKRTPGPSGGMYSTASDYARFLQMILNEGQLGNIRILQAATVRDMLRPTTDELVTGFTPGNQWAAGWCTLQHPQGVTRLLSPGTVGHGGAFGTQAWIDVQRGLVLVLMIQRTGFGNSDGSDVRDAFNEAVLTAYRGRTTPTANFDAQATDAGSITLKSGNAVAKLTPVGGRPLVFNVGDKPALWLDEAELQPTNGKGRSISAGRFDIGPELTTPAHPTLWSGTWWGEVTGTTSARFTSPRDPATGIQLLRDYSLEKAGPKGQSISLRCVQTMMNNANEVREIGHWGRSFSPGGGICLIPLAGKSKFPSQYAMYEDSAIINVKPQDDQIRVRDGFLEILAPPRKPKLGFDTTAGWFAYLMPNSTLFVKRFPVDANRVYGEAAGLTLSVWYPQGARIELEPIGPLEHLKPGEVARFHEEWTLLEYPFPKPGETVDLAALRKFVTEGLGE